MKKTNPGFPEAIGDDEDVERARERLHPLPGVPNVECGDTDIRSNAYPPFICSALGWQAHPSFAFLPSLQVLKNRRFSLPRFKAALSLTTLHHACWIGLLVKVQVVEWLQEVGPCRGSQARIVLLVVAERHGPPTAELGG
jgi:hypothetical protein